MPRSNVVARRALPARASAAKATMSAVSPLRVAFAGTPQFAVPALRALLASRHTVVGVLTQPDRPQGRGRQLLASPVKALALSAGRALYQPRRSSGNLRHNKGLSPPIEI